MMRRMVFGLLLALPILLMGGQTQAQQLTLRPGVDYEIIPDGQPWQPLNGKIEVAEVFAYWCPHCDHLQPLFSSWVARQKPDIRTALIPASFDPDDASGRAGFAIQRLGIAARAHPAIFRAIHTDLGLPRHPSIEEYSVFLSRFRVPEATLASMMKSTAVDADMQRSHDFILRSGISGTPTLVVNGRYKIAGNTVEAEFDNLDAVIAQIRKGLLK